MICINKIKLNQVSGFSLVQMVLSVEDLRSFLHPGLLMGRSAPKDTVHGRYVFEESFFSSKTR